VVSGRALKEAAAAIHAGKGCTCRLGAKGDAQTAIDAYLRATRSPRRSWAMTRRTTMPPDPKVPGPVEATPSDEAVDVIARSIARGCDSLADWDAHWAERSRTEFRQQARQVLRDATAPGGPLVTRETAARWTDEQYAQLATVAEQALRRAERAEALVQELCSATGHGLRGSTCACGENHL
jgi:hypothetical protein